MMAGELSWTPLQIQKPLEHGHQVSPAKKLSVNDMQEYDNITFLGREDNAPGVILQKGDSKVWTPIHARRTLYANDWLRKRDPKVYFLCLYCFLIPHCAM